MAPKTAPTNRIAEIRKEKGLTQQQLADKVGKHWITISKLERGLIRLTDTWMQTIAEALEVQIADLFPSVRRLITVEIEGEVFPGGKLSPYNDDEPHSLTLHSGWWQSEASRWYYVNTDALWPYFQDGDAVCFAPTSWPASKLIGRLAMVWIEGRDDPVVGVLHRGRTRERFTVAVPGQAPLQDQIVNDIAPVIAAVYDVETEGEQRRGE